MNKIDIERKKEFIDWLLTKYQLQKRECFWLLKEISGNKNMLKKINFVEKAVNYDNAIEMSVYSVEGSPFKYYKNSVEITDAHLMYEKIMENKEEILHLQINFPRKESNKMYVELITEEETVMENKRLRDEEIENIVNEIEMFCFKETVIEMIDLALDKKDRDEFIRLTKLMLERGV